LLPYNKDLLLRSRELRNNMIDTERALWSKLRRKQLKGYQFYRQKIIGNYIVDFYCPKARLVVEVDGAQHYSEEMLEVDKQRDDYLRGNALTVIRFSNLEVRKSLDGVVERILECLESPSIPLLVQGEVERAVAEVAGRGGFEGSVGMRFCRASR
jgi:very-short-patch-repair endonuclease